MTTFADEVLADLPVFFFRCNEITGTALADASGNGRVGTLFAPFQLQQAPMRTGTGASIGFTGGRAAVPYASALKPSGDYSIELIMNWGSTTLGLIFGIFNSATPFSGPSVFANYSSATDTEKAGTLVFRDSKGAEYSLEVGGAGNAYNDNVFRHFLLVRRGMNLEAWVNGTRVGTTALPGIRNVTDNAPAYLMGQVSTQKVSGALDEVAFYTHALDPARIRLHARLALELRMLKGTANLAGGAAANEVVARDWATHAHVQASAPASDGGFELWVPPGKYDVTVFGPAGYQPITHGPLDAVDF